MNYYNEIDPTCAQWLRNLISARLIPEGDVDERDIRDVRPIDLKSYTQCHFFAGIGGWARALCLAGIPADRPLWTGSCPCQPFSTAGQARGFADERHLWPYWQHLIGQCRPPIVLGEQVASKDGLAWLDLVHADLEGAGYAVGHSDLCAAGVGAPHIRQRLWFVAKSNGGDTGAEGLQRSGEQRFVAANGSAGQLEHAPLDGWKQRRSESGERRFERGCGESVVGDSHDARSQGWGIGRNGSDQRPAGAAGLDRELGDASLDGIWTFDGQPDAGVGRKIAAGGSGVSVGMGIPDCEREAQAGGFSGGEIVECVGGFWSGAEWLPCRDDKWRPVEPGSFPLAHGVPARVAKLRAFGNAIVPQVAAEFIRAALA